MANKRVSATGYLVSALQLTCLLALAACGADDNSGTVTGSPISATARGVQPATQRDNDASNSQRNTRPEVSGTPARQVAANTRYVFEPSANDLDGDTLKFTITGRPEWANFSPRTGLLSGKPSPKDIGLVANIRISVSDGKSNAALPPFEIMVTAEEAPNQAPRITGNPAQSVTAGNSYMFTPTATDPNDDALQFSISNKPKWAKFNQQSGALEGIPTKNDIGTTENISITVSDGKKSKSLDSFSVKVKKQVITEKKYNPGHYISMNRLDSHEKMHEALQQPGVKGIQVRFYWKQLERSFDKYDFKALQADLDIAAKYGKMMVVIVEDKTFNGDIPTPGYLATEHTVANRNGGYTVLRWNSRVVERYKSLLRALGNEFDEHPAFEGVAIQESSLSLDDGVLAATGYRPELYRDAIIETLEFATKQFPKSQVFWYMNFLKGNQGYLEVIARRVAPLGVAMGGPDVLPDSRELSEMTYPLYKQFNGKMTLFNSMQYDSYFHRHQDTSYKTPFWTPDELFEFARDELNLNYMFWNRKKARIPKTSYSWLDALPVIEANANFN